MKILQPPTIKFINPSLLIKTYQISCKIELKNPTLPIQMQNQNH